MKDDEPYAEVDGKPVPIRKIEPEPEDEKPAPRPLRSGRLGRLVTVMVLDLAMGYLCRKYGVTRDQVEKEGRRRRRKEMKARRREELKERRRIRRERFP